MSDPLEPTNFSVRVTDNIVILMIASMVTWLLFSTYCNQSREASETESSPVFTSPCGYERRMTTPD